MPAVRFDPTLVEAVVSAEIDRNERVGDGRLVEAFHRLADPIYERVPLDERETAFEPLYARFFERLGYPALFAELFAEVPDLEKRARGLLVLTARHQREEGTVIGRDEQSVCLRIWPARFADCERLVAFIRHELVHAADMLDPSFGYQVATVGAGVPVAPSDEGAGRADPSLNRPVISQATATPGAATRLAGRYRALWCASVDARLIRRGVRPLAEREAHARDIESCFVSIPDSERLSLFERLWSAGQPTHAEMLALARQADVLTPASATPMPAPGALCPVCRFPTYCWATEIAPPIVALIRADVAAWQPDHGACERCVEGYALHAQVLSGVTP